MQSVMTPGSATEGVGEIEDRNSRMPRFGPDAGHPVAASESPGARHGSIRAASSAVLLAVIPILGALADAS
jgi:hypothetical protein